MILFIEHFEFSKMKDGEQISGSQGVGMMGRRRKIFVVIVILDVDHSDYCTNVCM